MERILEIDIETYSDVDLIKCGVYAYADSPAFEVLLFAYSFDGGETQVVDLAQGEELPGEVVEAVFDKGIMKTAFNANFERTCLSKHFGRYLYPESWHCSEVQAAMLALPRSLEEVGTVLGLEQQKMKEGKDLIRYFCVPCKPTKANGGRTRNLPCHAPEKWELFKAYCIRDVDVEKGIRRKLQHFPISESEMELYCLDQKINDRGVLVDRKLVQQAVSCDLLYKNVVTKRAYELTGLENPNSVAQIKSWLGEQGMEIDSLSKKAVGDLIQETNGEVEELLKLRLLMAKTSVKKYEAMERSVCTDGRVHGLLQFYGANRTGRWCLTGDHEVLTFDGWKRLDEWKGGVVACWHPNGEVVSFQKAEQVEFHYEGLMYEYNDKRISQISTPDHKMYVKRRYGGAWREDIVENMQVYRPSIPFTGVRRTASGMEHERLRVMVMVQADGHYTEDGTIRLQFKKKRKIDRCKHLLRRASIPFIMRDNAKTGVGTFTVASRDVPLWLRIFKSKLYGAWLFDESADVFFDELPHWDGYHSAANSIQYSTCCKQNADMVQAFAHISGRCAVIRVKKRSEEHPNWKDSYVVDIWMTPGNCHEIRSKAEVSVYSGKVYCAVTRTGYFLVRRNGRVWITGNSGRLVQVQNLPQNYILDLELARSLVKQGRFEDVELLYDSTPNVLSELIRTAFIPKPGCRFVVADFSAIEARVLAWLSGEKWRLDVFASHGRIYEASASAMFHVPIEEVTKGSPLRQKGKISELALGYGGSVGALTSMGALDMGLSEEELPPLVSAWRKANPHITQFWWDVDAAAVKTVTEKKKTRVGKITIEYKSGILFVELPSGRRLSYVKPRMALNKFGRNGLTYEGIAENKKWSRIETYGPKLVENIIQGTARDLLGEAMLQVEEKGYPIVMHCHDEIIAEVPDGTGSVEEMCAVMAVQPEWAEGLPLRADGYECAFYKKE